ncbi:MAG: SufD family Fe-S cluster assembly protein [Candidatus Aenigmarchaeota archaeon]|nr:SufD family Fe-S cluster assembly protein [Candidatus Aenigmarchaeota archaeon]
MKELIKFVNESEMKIKKIKEEEMKLKNEELNIIIPDKTKNILNINVHGKSKINQIVNGNKIILNNKIHVHDNSSLEIQIKSIENDFVILYDEITLGKNSELKYVFKSKTKGKIFHFVGVSHKENARSNVSIRSNIHGSFVSLGKLIFTEEASNSKGELEQLVITNENSEATLLPILLVKNKNAKAHHRAKKIIIRDEDLFYLNSKGLDKKSIEKLIEKFVMG